MDKLSLFEPETSLPLPTTVNATRHANQYTRRADYFFSHRNYDFAIDLYLEAIRINPRHAKAYFMLAQAYQHQGKLEKAIDTFRKTLSCQPDHRQANASLILLLMQTCSWPLLKLAYTHLKKINDIIPPQSHQPPPLHPFISFSLDEDQGYGFKQAKSWSHSIAHSVKPHKDRLDQITPSPPGVIPRLGYMGSCFNQSPLGESLLQIVSLHVSHGFTVHCFHHGKATGSRLLQRLAKTATSYSELQHESPEAYASVIKKSGVDILIDLDGLLPSGKLDVLSLRPAAIQVTWLGIPSPTASQTIDYLLTDHFTLTAAASKSLTESPLILPFASAPPFPQFPPTTHRYKRSQFNLSVDAFIFANFSPTRLYTQKQFELWLALLAKVPPSLLWLQEDNPDATKNCLRVAKARGIDPSRLIFTSPQPLIASLERVRLVNLLLDTYPVSDYGSIIPSLYAGTPVLTQAGVGLASRLGASVLATANLPELITSSDNNYLNTAIKFATNQKSYSALKTKVQNLDPDLPIFNAPAFTQALEEAYQKIWTQHRSGQSPQDIRV
jgi:protein O-GlcNAc transferase